MQKIYLNVDTLGGRIGELLSYNVFTYCENNPIVTKDPSGYVWWLVLGGAAIGALVGVAYSYYTKGSVQWY